MRNRKWYDENRYRLRKGLPERELGGSSHFVQRLEWSEWSEKFERLMRNRLIMGAIRYGVIKGVDKPLWDRVNSIKSRLQLYQETGNKEYLVDIANLALLEFEESVHPNSHFKAIDDGEHVKI